MSRYTITPYQNFERGQAVGARRTCNLVTRAVMYAVEAIEERGYDVATVVDDRTGELVAMMTGGNALRFAIRAEAEELEQIGKEMAK